MHWKADCHFLDVDRNTALGLCSEITKGWQNWIYMQSLWQTQIIFSKVFHFLVFSLGSIYFLLFLLGGFYEWSWKAVKPAASFIAPKVSLKNCSKWRRRQEYNSSDTSSLSNTINFFLFLFFWWCRKSCVLQTNRNYISQINLSFA